MERLPRYWAVKYDNKLSEEEYKESVISYLQSLGHNNWTTVLVLNRYFGISPTGVLYNYSDHLLKEVNDNGKIIILPLHLFKKLVENEKKSQPIKRLVTKTDRISGYTLKDGVSNEAALRALGISETSPMFRNAPSLPITFEVNTTLYNAAVNVGVLDLLFTPIYKKPSSTVIVRHRTGHLVATIENGYVTIDGQRFSTADVQRILSSSRVKGIPFIPTTFTTGCNNQYEGISRKDIEQVLDQMLPF